MILMYYLLSFFFLCPRNLLFFVFFCEYVLYNTPPSTYTFGLAGFFKLNPERNSNQGDRLNVLMFQLSMKNRR